MNDGLAKAKQRKLAQFDAIKMKTDSNHICFLVQDISVL